VLPHSNKNAPVVSRGVWLTKGSLPKAYNGNARLCEIAQHGQQQAWNGRLNMNAFIR
jgi:hypothetical protein